MAFPPKRQRLRRSVTAFSVAPIYYGVLTANVTDPLPVLLGLVGVLCLAKGRARVGRLCHRGWDGPEAVPVLLLPVGLVYLASWRSRLVLLLAAGVPIVAALVPPAVANFGVFMSPFHWQTSRPPWESWYAFVNWSISAPHDFRAPYFQDSAVGDAFGWVFWGITPRVAALLTPVPSPAMRWENVVSLVGTLVSLALCALARRDRRTSLSLVRWSLFAFAAFLFWGVGWSPQYELYLVPLIALAVRPTSIGVGVALLLEGLTLLEYPVLLPWAYYYGGSVVWLMWATLLSRYLVLAWLCVYVLEREADFRGLARRVMRSRGAIAVGCRLADGAESFCGSSFGASKSGRYAVHRFACARRGAGGGDHH